MEFKLFGYTRRLGQYNASGVPGRSAAELHDVLQESIWECLQTGEPFAGCKVDLRKAFDKANAAQAIHILEKLGMPSGIGDVLRSFYDNHRKWFELDGAVTRGEISVTNGLLQGCPASMLLLAAQATLWVRNVKAAIPEVDVGIYVDDRSLFGKGDDSPDVLLRASKAGDLVDKALGHQKHPYKLESFGRGTKVKRVMVAQE